MKFMCKSPNGCRCANQELSDEVIQACSHFVETLPDDMPYDTHVPIPEAFHGKHQKLLVPLINAPHGASIWLPKTSRNISGTCQKLFGHGGYRSMAEAKDGVNGVRVWRLRP